ncbi:uncharacterized protein LOC113147331 [Cyclospora cayetanensis]|uniref:Uncharacterized protein LOC113147331 n=1 Tax=Cyclospora cayetanensis TaxID=88456 RepID=A0A6P6S218_9EIME|nr:uncharacterized protein LOC113147331 [Cyclospora cayetanensis]
MTTMEAPKSVKDSFVSPPQQQGQQLACCADLGCSGGCGKKNCSSCNSKLSLKDIYGRFAAAALVNSTLSGTVSLVSALLFLRRRGLRVFTVGVGVGGPLGWTLRDADLYLKDPVANKRLLPSSCDPLVLLQQHQQQLQLSTSFIMPYVTQIRQRFFPSE